MDQKWIKNGPKMIKNVHNRLKETKTRLERIQFRVNGSKKQYARFLVQIRHISLWIWW